MFPLKDNVPTRAFPIVTVLLIAINVAVWLFYQVPDLDASVAELAYQPCEVVDECSGRDVGQDWQVTALTSMFMHGDWLHIGGNMLFLWIFGNNVEDAMGHARFLVFYLLAGFAATALQTFVTLAYGSELEATIPNLGASGAVSGVLGAYLILLPRASVLILIFLGIILIREVPAALFLGFWFLFQLWLGGFSLVEPQAGGGVAFFAHIGGFVFGLAAVFLFADRDRRRLLRPSY
jgi:membrane associated rhomboid family serine protease